jgi:hypothetical protein
MLGQHRTAGQEKESRTAGQDSQNGGIWDGTAGTGQIGQSMVTTCSKDRTEDRRAWIG